MAVSVDFDNPTGKFPKKEKKKKPLWKRIVKRTLLTLAMLIALVAITISIALYTVFTPKKITPIVLNFANDYLAAEVGCESVELTFFSTFPNLGVVLKNGKIIKPLNAADSSVSENTPQDTLLTFRRCMVSFNPVAFLRERKIIVHKLRLNTPCVYAYKNSDGRANWDIVPPSDSVAVVSDTAKIQMPELNVKGIRIRNARIIYDDREQDVFAAVDSLNLSIDGNMSKDSARLDWMLGIKTTSVFYEGKALAKRLPLRIEARIHNNRISKSLSVEQAKITAGVLNFNASGTIQADSVRHQALVNIDFGLNASSLSELLQMIPEQLSNVSGKLLTTGELNFQGKLNGYLGKGSVPLFTASAQLKGGSLRSAKHPEKSGLQKIEFKSDAQIDFNKQEDSYLQLENFFLQTASSAFKCSGKFNDIFTKPLIDANIEADINFNRMAQDLTLADSLRMGGAIKANLSGKCFLDDMLVGNYGKINASGMVDIDDVVFQYPKENIDFFASLVKLRLGSNTSDSIRGRLVESLLRGNIELDSLSLNYGNIIHANVGKLSARFHTSASKDSGAIAVLSTTVGAEKLNLRTSDSLQARAVKTRASLRLAPSASDKTKPELSATITLDSLRGRMPGLSGRVNNAAFKMTIKRQIASNNNRQRQSDDSISRARRSDSARRQNQSSNLSFRLASDNAARKAVQDLDISGTFECKNMNLRTPAFPLPLRMSQSSLGFTTDNLLLNQTRVKAGSSDMVLTGEVTGIRRALLRNGKLTAKITIESEMMDCNQLIRAFAAGSEYAEKEAAEKDSITQVVLDDTKELAVEADTGAIGIFVIPRNIDFELTTRVKKVAYTNLLLDDVSGEVIIRNQAVQLSGLQLASEAIGNAHLSLVYKAPDTKGANLGLDLQLQQIQVKELIAAFPMIDTLTPMLRSFEGVVDCDISAITSLDAQSNVKLPETSASCYLKGENLVVMDSETFAEIAKMLLFKNKKRNMIDSISVELVLEDSKVMVFPFRVSVDRYVAGVGGTQNLDMSFDYHISVLKSPVPFRLGLNISGTPDKIKFRLAKAKYKDLFTPAKEKSLATEQINLRRQMKESLRKSIAEIIEEPLSAPVRRPRMALSDSLQKEYFQLDTTKVEMSENAMAVDEEE